MLLYSKLNAILIQNIALLRVLDQVGLLRPQDQIIDRADGTLDQMINGLDLISVSFSCSIVNVVQICCYHFVLPSLASGVDGVVVGITASSMHRTALSSSRRLLEKHITAHFT